MEGIYEITQPQPPAAGKAAPYQLRLPRAPSNPALNASRDGEPAALRAACSSASPPSELKLLSYHLS